MIHGYFHERPRRPRETLLDKLITRIYTQNEGEFYDLGYDEALRRIVAARDELRAHGLKPRGFVAPAWLLGEEAERAARDAQMEYTTRLRTVCDLRSGNVFSARALVYSVCNGWRRGVSRAGRGGRRGSAAEAAGLKAGDVGWVVLIHAGGAGYEVEFVTLAGETVSVVTVPARAVRPVRAKEIAHARMVA